MDSTTATSSAPGLSGPVRWSRTIAVVSLLALIVLGLCWELWLAPTGRGTLALKVLPLTVPLAGLLKHRMYTYRWLSLLVWVYFAEGVVRAASDTGAGRWLALIEIGLCIALFVACAIQVRARLRAANAAPPAQTDDPAHV